MTHGEDPLPAGWIARPFEVTRRDEVREQIGPPTPETGRPC